MGAYCKGFCSGNPTFVKYSAYVLPRGGALCNSCKKGIYNYNDKLCPCCHMTLRRNKRIKRGEAQEMLARIE